MEEVKISSRRLEIARERLEPGDEVRKSYSGRLDNKGGMLMFSNSKLVFVEEKGFLSKTYNVLLDLPYEKVRECTVVERHRLRITDSEDKQHELISDISTSTVDKALKELMETAPKTKSEEIEKETTIQ